MSPLILALLTSLALSVIAEVEVDLWPNSDRVYVGQEDAAKDDDTYEDEEEDLSDYPLASKGNGTFKRGDFFDATGGSETTESIPISDAKCKRDSLMFNAFVYVLTRCSPREEHSRRRRRRK